MYSTFTAIKEKNGEYFKEVLPFNPLLEGWSYVSACCCKVTFQKGGITLKVEKKNNCMYVVNGDEVKDVLVLPHSQYEFKIMSQWL